MYFPQEQGAKSRPLSLQQHVLSLRAFLARSAPLPPPPQTPPQLILLEDNYHDSGKRSTPAPEIFPKQLSPLPALPQFRLHRQNRGPFRQLPFSCPVLKDSFFRVPPDGANPSAPPNQTLPGPSSVVRPRQLLFSPFFQEEFLKCPPRISLGFLFFPFPFYPKKKSKWTAAFTTLLFTPCSSHLPAHHSLPLNACKVPPSVKPKEIPEGLINYSLPYVSSPEANNSPLYPLPLPFDVDFSPAPWPLFLDRIPFLPGRRRRLLSAITVRLSSFQHREGQSSLPLPLTFFFCSRLFHVTDLVSLVTHPMCPDSSAGSKIAVWNVPRRCTLLPSPLLESKFLAVQCSFFLRDVFFTPPRFLRKGSFSSLLFFFFSHPPLKEVKLPLSL